MLPSLLPWGGVTMMLFPKVAIVALLAAETALAQQEFLARPHEHTAPVKVKALPADVHTTGIWNQLPFGSPMNPVHIALLRTGKVLIIAGSGNYPTEKVFTAGVWDPPAGFVRTQTIGTDMFCNGMVMLPDGRAFVVGGTKSYERGFSGLSSTALFDPQTETFTPAASMANGRWYPTVTVMPDGTVMAASGIDKDGVMNPTVEIYDPKKNTWGGEIPGAYPSLQFYPRQHLLPNGKVFESGFNANTQIWDPAAKSWTFVADTQLGKNRIYGSSVLLPLMPASGYKPVVLILGGDSGAPGGADVTNTAETIDLSAPNPQWVTRNPMAAPRMDLNATLLPNGKVLVSGGSSRLEDAAAAVLTSEIYDPATGTFAPAAVMNHARLYHSNAILLPDATVLALGSNPHHGDYQGLMEIYSPPYLFTECGQRVTARPVISNVPAAPVAYGSTFTVNTPFPDAIQSVVVMRPGAVTHAFDMEQRLIGTTFVRIPGGLSVTAPPNGNVAPPGWYLIFILDAGGTPSVGKFVQFG